MTSPDTRLRELERRAALGDPQAAEQLARARDRVTAGAFAELDALLEAEPSKDAWDALLKYVVALSDDERVTRLERIAARLAAWPDELRKLYWPRHEERCALPLARSVWISDPSPDDLPESLAHVTELEVSAHPDFEPGVLATLLKRGVGEGLRSLCVRADGSAKGEDLVQLLSGLRLESFRLGADLTPTELDQVWTALDRSRLRELDLYQLSCLGASGMASLTGHDWPVLARLELRRVRVGDAGLGHLVENATHFPTLTNLDLLGNRIHHGAFGRLVESPLWGQLEKVEIGNNVLRGYERYRAADGPELTSSSSQDEEAWIRHGRTALWWGVPILTLVGLIALGVGVRVGEASVWGLILDGVVGFVLGALVGVLGILGGLKVGSLTFESSGLNDGSVLVAGLVVGSVVCGALPGMVMGLAAGAPLGWLFLILAPALAVAQRLAVNHLTNPWKPWLLAVGWLVLCVAVPAGLVGGWLGG